MNVYQIDIKLVATAYIKAETEEEAKRIVRKNLVETGGELPTSDNSPTMGDITVSGKQYDDPDLPEWSLSPAVTLVGPFDEELEVELTEEDVPELGED